MAARRGAWAREAGGGRVGRASRGDGIAEKFAWVFDAGAGFRVVGALDGVSGGLGHGRVEFTDSHARFAKEGQCASMVAARLATHPVYADLFIIFGGDDFTRK